MQWFEITLHAADSILRTVMGMRPKFLLRRKNNMPPKKTVFTANQVRSGVDKLSDDSGTISKKLPTRSPELVVARPARLDERYVMVETAALADAAFAQFQAIVLQEVDRISQEARRFGTKSIVTKEVGKTADGRRFIFLKPFNDYGWLIERNGPGWRMSRAEKIVRDGIFMRGQGDPWDQVLVYHVPQDQDRLFRVKSQRFGGDLLTLTVYEDQFRSALQQLFARNVMLGQSLGQQESFPL
jgi:hypothetical protein